LINPEKIILSLKQAWDNYGEFISVPPIFMATYVSAVGDETIKFLFAVLTAGVSTIVIMWTKYHFGKILTKRGRKKNDKEL